MKESELYINYIKASRSGNKCEIDQMIKFGFKPDKQRLFELCASNEELRKTLFNRSIAVHIDMGSTAGHVYGKFPIFDETKTKISEEYLGFYPKEEGLMNGFMGKGAVLNEASATGRLNKQYQTVQIYLPVTEEGWQRLASWTRSETKRSNSYLILDNNCVQFVHNALKVAGYSDGLIDKFDPGTVAKMKLKPIAIDLNGYLRYDKREEFLPTLNQILEPRSEAIQSGSYVWQHKEAKAKRVEAEQATQRNFVNGFFERYHNAQFYQKVYQHKPLGVEDIAWLLRNQAPGMEFRIRDTLLESYHQAPLKLKQEYQCNPKMFLWEMSHQLQVCPDSIHPEIRKILSSHSIIRKASHLKETHMNLVSFDNGSALELATSLLPTFFYVNPEKIRTFQCMNYHVKDQVGDRVGEKYGVVTKKEDRFFKANQSFAKECERRLNQLLGQSSSKSTLTLVRYTEPRALESVNDSFTSIEDELGCISDFGKILCKSTNKNYSGKREGHLMSSSSMKLANATSTSSIGSRSTQINVLSISSLDYQGLSAGKRNNGWEKAAIRLNQMQAFQSFSRATNLNLSFSKAGHNINHKRHK